MDTRTDELIWGGLGNLRFLQVNALMGGSLSSNGHLLPQSFLGDGIAGSAFELGCFYLEEPKVTQPNPN